MANIDFSGLYDLDARTIRSKVEEASKKKEAKEIKVGVAYQSFFSTIRSFIPQAFLIKSEEDVHKCDLVIFTGGEDINPGYYGEEMRGTSYVNTARDEAEQRIFDYARGSGIPMFGICRGHQLIAALCGGSLFQDIAMDVRLPHGGHHKIEYHLPTDIQGIYPQTVNSMHHQGVNRVPKGFNVVASYNEVPEILEAKRILTTQFHPEFSSQGQQFFDWLLEKWLPKTLKGNYQGGCSNGSWYNSRRKPIGDTEYDPRRPRSLDDLSQRISAGAQAWRVSTASTSSIGAVPAPSSGETIEFTEDDTSEDEDSDL